MASWGRVIQLNEKGKIEMVKLITGKKFLALVLALVLSCGLGLQVGFAGEESAAVVANNGVSGTNEAPRPNAIDKAQDQKIFDMLLRIETLEQRLTYIQRQIELTLAVKNIAQDAKELSGDAWSLAVEARAVAMRAEEKADRAVAAQKR